jgi:hypothetical protein
MGLIRLKYRVSMPWTSLLKGLFTHTLSGQLTFIRFLENPSFPSRGSPKNDLG